MNVRKALLVSLVVTALLAACGPAPTPEILRETVEVPVEVPVEQTVVVEKTVEVESTVEVMQEVEVVTIAYNNYFNMTFGPADPPIEAIRAAVAEKYPHIRVEFNVMPYEAGPWHDLYVTWFTAEDGTTDLMGVGAYWTAEFGEAGWLLPLDDMISQDILDQLNPAYLDAHTYQGQLLGLGPWWGGIGGLYYRTDLLEEYGFEPPETYDDLVAIAEAIIAEEPNMTGWTWPALNDQVLVNRWTEFLNGFGGSYFHDDGTCAMNSEEAVEALEFMVSLIQRGISPREITTWKEEDSQIRFVSGQSIFHTGRQDMMFWLDNPDQSQIVGNWDFIPMPAQPGGRSTGYYEGWAFSISRFSDSPEAAARVLEVMFDLDVQKAFNLSQGPIQANMNVYNDPEVIENNPNLPKIQAVADTAEPPIPSPYHTELADILSDELHAALTGIKQPQAALDAACSQIDAIQQ